MFACEGCMTDAFHHQLICVLIPLACVNCREMLSSEVFLSFRPQKSISGNTFNKVSVISLIIIKWISLPFDNFLALHPILKKDISFCEPTQNVCQLWKWKTQSQIKALAIIINNIES